MQLKLIMAGAALLALSACMTNVEKLNKTNTSDEVFHMYLAEGYKEIANVERKEKDWRFSEDLARKGLAAANGHEVLPCNPANYKFKDTEAAVELGEAREDLMKALDSSAKKMHPKSIAAAQVNYDCWLHEAQAHWRAKDASTCRDRFYSFMTDSVFKDGGKLEIRSMEDGYVVYFDFNKTSLNAVDRINLQRMVSYLMADNPSHITVDGYADTYGPYKGNKAIALKRAYAIAKHLKGHGLKHTNVKIASHGESDLAIYTADNVKEELNRRVEIRAHK